MVQLLKVILKGLWMAITMGFGSAQTNCNWVGLSGQKKQLGIFSFIVIFSWSLRWIAMTPMDGI